MTSRGRGGGHLPPNRGGRGVHVGERVSPNTNCLISSIHPTTIESTCHILQEPSLPIVQEQHGDHFEGESSSTTFFTKSTMN